MHFCLLSLKCYQNCLVLCSDVCNIVCFFAQLSHKVYSLLVIPTLDEPIIVYINCTANWSHDTVGGAVSLLPDCSKGVKSRWAL